MKYHQGESEAVALDIESASGTSPDSRSGGPLIQFNPAKSDSSGDNHRAALDGCKETAFYRCVLRNFYESFALIRVEKSLFHYAVHTTNYLKYGIFP